MLQGQVALAECSQVDHLAPSSCRRNHAGDFLGIAFLVQHLVDLSLALKERPPVSLCKWRDHPPVPARSAFGAMRRSQSRDEAKGSQARQGPGDKQNCHTLSHLSGKPLQPAVTLYRIGDMLITGCH
jgi:hypothetical protein